MGASRWLPLFVSSALLGAFGAVIIQAPEAAAVPAVQPAVFSTPGCVTWSMPTGVSAVSIAATGAAGGSQGAGIGGGAAAGGYGDTVRAILSDAAGSTLDVCTDVGGGSGGNNGGGASGVSLGSFLTSPVLVAGGGGGAGGGDGCGGYCGSGAGGNVSQNGTNPRGVGLGAGTFGYGAVSSTTAPYGSVGVGGTTSYATAGSSGSAPTDAAPGVGGSGGSGFNGGGGGGGGGGYYGGGGGGGSAIGYGGPGGGGGSDYCVDAAVVTSSVAGCAVLAGGVTTPPASVTITPITEAVAFTSAAPSGSAAVVGGSYSPTATVSAEFPNDTPGTASFSVDPSSDAGVCVQTGSSANFLLEAPGTCIIDVSATTSADGATAPVVTQSFTIVGDPALSWNQPGPIVYGSTLAAVLNASSGGVTGVFSYTAAGSGSTAYPETAVSSTTVLAAGAYTLTATFTPSSAGYLPGVTVSTDLTVTPATPVVSITNLPATGIAGSSFTPDYTTTGDGTVFNVTVSPGTVCAASQSGTVEFLTAGTCTLTPSVAATNNYTQATGTPVEVTVDAPATITSTATAYLPWLRSGSFTITTAGTPTATVTETGTLPYGLAFTPGPGGTATIAGTAGLLSLGTHTVTITATNGVGAPAVQTLTVVVGFAPALAAPTSAHLTVGHGGDIRFFAFGYPVPSLTVIGALPAGMTFVDNGDGTGALTGTPATASTGLYNIEVTATNPFGASTRTVTIDVHGLPRAAPITVTNPGAQTSTTGTAASLAIAATDSAYGQTLSYSATGLPAGLTIETSSGLISGTPTSVGIFPVAVTATDKKGASGSAAFTWTVAPPEPPTAQQQACSVNTLNGTETRTRVVTLQGDQWIAGNWSAWSVCMTTTGS